MTDIADPVDSLQTKPRRPWNRHSFYMSDQMAALAAALARREQTRTGRQTGAGQVIDRAMREYGEVRLAPGELEALLNGHGRD